jgi:UDP-glucuronate 4-epimerase
MATVFVTGTAGFIGFHLARHLLDEGFTVVGYDGLTDYYDVSLKESRHAILEQNPNFRAQIGMLEDHDLLSKTVAESRPDVIVHLAAQAGVRYSLENPRAYIESNLVGTFNLMEAARAAQVDHLLMASTSSVYGGNTQMPFDETQKTDLPLTLYAATKKANESMAHSYAHLWHIPTTMFRFFTVYGTYGRPDLALFKFVRAALAGEAIDIYNHGQMARDFTYVGDLVKAIRLLIDAVPPRPDARDVPIPNDSLSPVAPFRSVNIGNGASVPLMEFITELEKVLGQEIGKNMMEMQKGDVPATWANTDLLEALTGYRPNTPISEGIRDFVAWYRDHYRV